MAIDEAGATADAAVQGP